MILWVLWVLCVYVSVCTHFICFLFFFVSLFIVFNFCLSFFICQFVFLRLKEKREGMKLDGGEVGRI